MCFKWVPVVAGLVFLGSCSVKESRTDCPCTLRIELRGLPGPADVQLVAGDYQASYHAGGDTVMVVQAPKGDIHLMAVSGAALEPDQPLRIPLGFECPPVYLYAAPVNTRCDSTRVSVELNKHFCTLSLTLEGPAGWGEPYWAEVRGSVEGLDREGNPSGGAFNCRLDTGLSVRLPRQNPDDALWLDITMPDRVVRTFPLGSYMLDAGYDWTAPSLADLPLQINLSVTEIIVRMGLWTQVIPLTLDI